MVHFDKAGTCLMDDKESEGKDMMIDVLQGMVKLVVSLRFPFPSRKSPMTQDHACAFFTTY